MSENGKHPAKHTMSDLYQMQGLSLDMKIKMTKRRIAEWDEYWGGCTAVSFSGGKDSTVLLHIARQVRPDMKAVFFDTGMELPCIKRFVRTFENVDIIKPKMTFPQVVKEYGYPVVSKETAMVIEYSKKTIDKHREQLETEHGGNGNYRELNIYAAKQHYYNSRLEDVSVMHEYEINIQKKEGVNLSSKYNSHKWKFMLDAPFNVSSKCCSVMKKSPAHQYEKETGIKPIQAIMASESMRRASSWLKNGCNGFDMGEPRSIPMAFWTEKDVLAYIYKYKIPIAEAYGDVVRIGGSDNYDQLELFDLESPIFETTKAKRTGCYTCGFGIHLDKSPTRLELLEPQLRDVTLKGGRFENGLWVPYKGFGFYFVYKWMNVHGNLNIIIPDEDKYYDALPEEAKKMLSRDDKKWME